MRIEKACLHEASDKPIKRVTLVDVPIGTVFRYHHGIGLYVRIADGAVCLVSNRFHTQNQLGDLDNYVSFPDAYVVTGKGVS